MQDKRNRRQPETWKQNSICFLPNLSEIASSTSTGARVPPRAHTSAADGYTHLHSLCALSGIIGYCFSYLNHRKNTSGLFPLSSPLLHELISSPHIIHPPSLPHPSILQTDYVISMTNGSFLLVWRIRAQQLPMQGFSRLSLPLPRSVRGCSSSTAPWCCCETVTSTEHVLQQPSSSQGQALQIFPPAQTWCAEPHLPKKERNSCSLQVSRQLLISCMDPTTLGQSTNSESSLWLWGLVTLQRHLKPRYNK